jgi:squalene cyclase
MELQPDFSIDGWCHPHVEVTAAAGRALAAAGSESRAFAHQAWRFIAKQPTKAGYWQSYWWTLPHYPTFQCVALACAIPEVRHNADVFEPVARWLYETQLPDGGWGPTPGDPSSPFATALGISTLALISAEARAVRRGVKTLIELQERDGSWAASPFLQIPPPNIAEPSQQLHWRIGQLGSGVVIADQHRLYTTASCVGALAVAGIFDGSRPTLSC